MRAKRSRGILPQPSCNLCKHGQCLHEEIPKVIFKINPGYTGRITRSIKKVIDHTKNFILLEVYRCMPLIGGEEMVPNWDVHIVRYAVVFTGKTH